MSKEQKYSGNCSEARNHPLYRYAYTFMKRNEWRTLLHTGWNTPEDHALYVAALDRHEEEGDKIREKLKAAWKRNRP